MTTIKQIKANRKKMLLKVVLKQKQEKLYQVKMQLNTAFLARLQLNLIN